MFAIVRRLFGRRVGKKDSDDESQDEENDLTEEEIHVRARSIARALLKPPSTEVDEE